MTASLERLVIAGLAAASIGAPPATAAQDSLADVRERYEEYQRRLPFAMAARGWELIARTADPAAISILAADYADPRRPKDQARFLMVDVARRHFRELEHTEAMDLWRAGHSDLVDAWLWHVSLAQNARYRGPEAALAVVRDGEQETFLRAAAIAALGEAHKREVLPAIGEICQDLPKNLAERHALLATMGRALERFRRLSAERDFKLAALGLAHSLDDEKLPLSTRVTVARALGRALDVPERFIEGDAWVRVLSGNRGEAAGREYAKPRFFGVEATGMRIVYVIDMSDSMCKPIDLKGKPMGPRTGEGAAKKRKKKKGEPPDESDIPWNKIETRFDLAREHLRISLLRLEPEQSFSVVWFGDRADLLEGCKGMLPASKGNVKRVLRALDKIKVGSPQHLRPDGTLRGKTNLHGGLARAFAVLERGLSKGPVYVDPETHVEGCDTIFLLSDGDPTWDDWDQVDKNYHEDRIGDPESRKALPEADNIHYHGPYVHQERIRGDLLRMNLFRGVEIHAIGIGEAQLGFLQRLADIGGGKAIGLGG